LAMQKTTVAGIGIAVAVVMMLTGVFAALQADRTFSNTGAITTVNVGAFSDSGCTQTLSTVDWGSIVPGSSANKTIYIKNTGTTMVSLNMTVNAWSPANASSSMTLTWNREGTVLNVGNNVATLLVLTVSGSVSGITNFSFNATITGTQY
jgi:uncharacterized protein YpuA (DUF1002 family)